MEDSGLFEYKSFSGHIKVSTNAIPLSFFARIGKSGEVEFDFGTIALTSETKFLIDHWHNEGSEIKRFSLSGKSADGIEFKTENLHFNSLNFSSNKETGSCIRPTGGCLKGEFHSKRSKLVPKPIICMHVKGFKNFRQLRSKCNLGVVTMDADRSNDEPDNISGHISVSSDNELIDFSAWRTEAGNLLEHVRRLMSFASAAMLLSPVIEYFEGNSLEVVALSQVKQAPAPMRTIHFLNQQPVFDAAVTSFFKPPKKIKNLFFAIEWFSMDSTYNEVRLVNAMTVLENLVASNLSEQEAMIRPPKEYEKTRKKIRQVIKKCIEKWIPEEAEKKKEILIELNERLSDLNRRSIFRKFVILANKWSVPLDGISDDDFKAAKRARDLIVHQGHYYEEEKEASVDLWKHITVVREIIVRFLFTAIGYKGSYCSYLGGYHEEQFTPLADRNTN